MAATPRAARDPGRMNDVGSDLPSTPAAPAARLTYTGAPDAIQGAIAARTARLLTLAREHDLPGPHTRQMLRAQAAATTPSGVSLPLNAGGACGALLCDLGIDAAVLRGVAVMSRAAGAVGHLAEEARAPMGPTLWHLAERVAHYEPRRRG
jgi:hypothetical protein